MPKRYPIILHLTIPFTIPTGSSIPSSNLTYFLSFFFYFFYIGSFQYSTQYAEASLLLRAILDEGPSGLAQRALAQAGLDVKMIDSNLETHLNNQPRISDTTNVVMGKTMGDCLSKASQLKRDFGDQFISVEHLLLAAADTDGITKTLFRNAGSNATKLKEAVMAIRGTNKVTSRTPEATYEALKKYARDLTEAAKEGKLDPVIGRDEEIRRAIQILSRRTKNNPILLGEPGVGKTAIAEGLAQRIISGDVPETLKGIDDPPVTSLVYMSPSNMPPYICSLIICPLPICTHSL